MHKKLGTHYHWIPDLYRCMKLPVFDGISEALQRFNAQRKRALEVIKTEKCQNTYSIDGDDLHVMLMWQLRAIRRKGQSVKLAVRASTNTPTTRTVLRGQVQCHYFKLQTH